jgi:uncharacterized iron-regulated membrane protein
MKALSRPQLLRLVSVHGWTGAVLGLLLYAVVLTGTVAVFADRIEEWSAGGITTQTPIGPGTNTIIRSILDITPNGFLSEVSVFANGRGELLVFPHAEALNPESGNKEPYGALFRVDPITGKTLARDEGFVFRDPHTHEVSALSEFLVDLHVQLHVPSPWGLILTGVAGLAMVAFGATGFLMHRHIVRDIFVAPRPGQRLAALRDRHVLTGSWALLFTFILGFTGAYFSFAGTVFFPLLTEVTFGGDRDRMIAELFEESVPEDARYAQFVNLDAVIADATSRAGSPPRFLSIDNYGRRDARIATFHAPRSGEMTTVRTLYDGVSGAFLGFRQLIGKESSSGGVLMSLMLPLHTGDFAGTLSQSIWIGLGSAMAYLIVSGLQLWVRRREDELLWRRFGRAVTVVGYGLPVAMLMCAYAYFLALGAGADDFWWTPAGFLIGLIPGVVPGFVARNEDGLRWFYRLLLGIGLILLPIVRMATGGLDWATAIAQGQGTVLSVDLTLLLLGAGLVWWARRPRALPAPEPTPAE